MGSRDTDIWRVPIQAIQDGQTKSEAESRLALTDMSEPPVWTGMMATMDDAGGHMVNDTSQQITLAGPPILPGIDDLTVVPSGSAKDVKDGQMPRTDQTSIWAMGGEGGVVVSTGPLMEDMLDLHASIPIDE